MRQTYLLISLFALLPAAAHATLGGSEESIDLDRKQIIGTQSRTAQANYAVHEIVSSMHSVREYVSPDGKIFAVAWDGITHPDLSVLLGQYFPEYKQKIDGTPKPPGRAARNITTHDIVVELGGHMRAVHGMAYMPQFLPKGFNLREIK